MGFFPTGKEKDLSLGQKFLRHFQRIVIGKDKETGKLVLLFRSKNDAILEVGTDQIEPQVLEKVIE